MLTVLFCSACVFMITYVSVYEKKTTFSLLGEKKLFQYVLVFDMLHEI